MKFETIKQFTVMNGKDATAVRPGKTADSRDLGISAKSMAELERGGFIHVEKGQKEAAVQPDARKEGK